ncbi:hypothetical protein [Sinorhizobium meliloti]|uniref:hypothetical protein n=1 Tax=Rhizobium meliloti TaxID=382 RepID=UPI0030CD1DFF
MLSSRDLGAAIAHLVEDDDCAKAGCRLPEWNDRGLEDGRGQSGVAGRLTVTAVADFLGAIGHCFTERRLRGGRDLVLFSFIGVDLMIG